jgi:tetratricopeptide (TPR) repeat protein
MVELPQPPHESVVRLALSQESGDRYLTANILNDTGVQLLKRNELLAARENLERANAIYGEIGEAALDVRVNLAWVYLRHGDVDRAVELARGALRVARRTVDRSQTAYALLALACCAAARGTLSDAITLQIAADRELTTTGEDWQELEREFHDENLAALHSELGEAFESASSMARLTPRHAAIDLALGRVPAAQPSP